MPFKHQMYPNLHCKLQSLSVSNNLIPFHRISSKSSAPQMISPLSTLLLMSIFCMAHLHKGARMVVVQQVPQPRRPNYLHRSHGGWVDLVLTISKLKRWSINYYIDTARTAERASRDVARAGGGLGEYYTEHERPHVMRDAERPARPGTFEKSGISRSTVAGSGRPDTRARLPDPSSCLSAGPEN
jgi:hypothetical protein